MVQSRISLKSDKNDGKLTNHKQKKSRPVSTERNFLFKSMLLEFRRDSEL
jgi:hypothetical protein